MTGDQNIGNTPATSTVLITGGSGLVGRYLTSFLLSKGYNVSHLSRNANQFGRVRVYRWDPGKKILDPLVFEGVDYLIHLSGANIGEKRWTENRKSEIVSSRVDSLKFLHDVISTNRIKIKALISASAIGYYGSLTTDKIFSEGDSPSNDFLGTTCKLWEEAADLFNNDGIRTVKLRTAVVIEKNDSALSKLMSTAKYGFLVKAGNGRQYMPWIHINDLCNIYIKAIEDTGISGAYNAVSPYHSTQLEFVKTLARVINSSLFTVPVPAIILRAVLGEMSEVILEGSRVTSAKIINAGFHFRYTVLEDALKSAIYG